MADYIKDNNKSLTTITNKVALVLDLNTIKKYIKNANVIKSDEVITARLSQSKLYLKILGILYIIEDTNIPITANVVEKII